MNQLYPIIRRYRRPLVQEDRQTLKLELVKAETGQVVPPVQTPMETLVLEPGEPATAPSRKPKSTMAKTLAPNATESK